ncbi:ElyC/SanA/YdcF family protein [Chromatiaceae bacterium AAb-1]|nr:ElyC/SanA/YdcF family protein [Chromatiaceae bacterium AAb-1]
MYSFFKSMILPLPLLLLLLLIATILCWRGKTAGRWLLTVTLSLGFLCSLPVVVNRIAAPLELAHKPYTAGKAVDNILILGCQHQQYSFLPLSSKPADCSLARLVEGVRIWHRHPAATLYLSGDIPAEEGKHTEILRQLAVSLGVKAERIVLISHPRNTQQEAAALAPMIVDQHNVLVTSAMHMSRSVNWFRYYGAQVSEAPTHFQIRRPLSDSHIRQFTPSVGALQTLSYAQYEYLGLLQQKLKLWWDIENP